MTSVLKKPEPILYKTDPILQNTGSDSLEYRIGLSEINESNSLDESNLHLTLHKNLDLTFISKLFRKPNLTLYRQIKSGHDPAYKSEFDPNLKTGSAAHKSTVPVLRNTGHNSL